MKALIAYYSRSGHTKTMAGEISQAMADEGVEVTVLPIAELKAAALLNYDILIFGGPTYYGAMPYQIKQLLDESVALHGRLDGKIGGAFTSAANIAGGNETAICGTLQALLIHGMIVQGDPQGDHYGPVAINSPDQRSSEGCRRYGKRLSALAKKVFR